MSQASPASSSSSSLPRYAWVVLGVVYAAAIAAPMNQSKVPPLMPILRDVFDLELGQAGLLMSVFAFTGMILALPAGAIVQRLGVRTTGILAISSLIPGAVLGALAQNANLLLFSRVIEGVGMGLIAVAAPAAIAAWFPPDRRGAPMGVWATWVAVGPAIMLNLAPSVEAAADWRAVWWLGAGYAMAAAILFGLLVRMPDGAETPRGRTVTLSGLRRTLANRDVWMLALVFVGCAVINAGIAAYYPTYLNEVRGFSLARASSLSSITGLVMMVGAPLAGLLSDRLGTRRWLIVGSMLAFSVVLLFPFRVTGSWVLVYLVVHGLAVSALPSSIFAAVPEVMERPEHAGIGLAVATLGQTMGMVLGPVMLGYLVERAGWVPAGNWLIPVSLVAALVAWRVRVR